jgi:hypothetical protein
MNRPVAPDSSGTAKVHRFTDLPEASVGPFPEHNVVAGFSTMDEARGAITLLERAGIEGGDIEILGQGMKGVDQPSSQLETRRSDLAVTGIVGRRAAIGMITGAVAGVIVGAVLGFLAYELMNIGDLGTAGVVGAAVAGGAFGAATGAFYVVVVSLPVSEAYLESFQPVAGGEVAIAVHSDSADTIDAAIDRLRSADAKWLGRFGPDADLGPA